MRVLAMSASQGVTKVVDRVPRPGMEQRLEGAIEDLIAAATRFPGHLGVNVTRPAPPAQPGFRMIYRFDTLEHLRAWEQSPEQARLVAIANELTLGPPQRHVMEGLESWFTLPSSALARPSRARMSAVTWLGIFPLVYGYSLLLGLILPSDTPRVLGIALNTALVVPTMSYVVAPWLTRMFHGWLYPAPRAASEAELRKPAGS
jgi:antibiotic biosynthesis monooxygenase (ABM) superfamily enzyme